MDYHYVNENENHINHDRLYTIAIIKLTARSQLLAPGGRFFLAPCLGCRRLWNAASARPRRFGLQGLCLLACRRHVPFRRAHADGATLIVIAISSLGVLQVVFVALRTRHVGAGLAIIKVIKIIPTSAPLKIPLSIGYGGWRAFCKCSQPPEPRKPTRWDRLLENGLERGFRREHTHRCERIRDEFRADEKPFEAFEVALRVGYEGFEEGFCLW